MNINSSINAIEIFATYLSLSLEFLIIIRVLIGVVVFTFFGILVFKKYPLHVRSIRAPTKERKKIVLCCSIGFLVESLEENQ